jgi:hypothetical protein
MNRKLIWLGICFVALAASAAAQTNVTTTNGGTANTVPVFTSGTNVENSPISVSGSNVGIGTTSPQYPLQVNGEAFSSSGFRVFSSNGDDLNGAPWYGLGQASGSFSLTQGASNNFVQVAGFYGLNFQTGSGQVVIRGDNGNVGIGTTSPTQPLEVNGNIKVDGTAGTNGVIFPDGTTQTTAWTGVLCGGDYAEDMRAHQAKDHYEPGDVLVLTSDDKSDVQKSVEPYSTMVAGIYATKPGVVGLRDAVSKATDKVPMAMVGVVPTKVSAENGPIHKGDLLVTSSRMGYAMKGTDRSRMLGAVIGKAMGSLNSGTGVIEVLVTLQ